MAGINLKKNILMGGSFRAIIMIFSFFCSLITARYLGVELKGEYSYLVTVGGFLWMILDTIITTILFLYFQIRLFQVL